MEKIIDRFEVFGIWTTIIAFVMCFTSCGPSREEIENAAVLVKYKQGDVVYLKPDSCQAVITGTTASYNFNTGTSFAEYWVRDCHGINVRLMDEFIYGLK